MKRKLSDEVLKERFITRIMIIANIITIIIIIANMYFGAWWKTKIDEFINRMMHEPDESGKHCEAERESEESTEVKKMWIMWFYLVSWWRKYICKVT